MDCDKHRNAEMNSLMKDARNWAANGYVDVRDMNGGTPLHVAAAKGYTEVSIAPIIIYTNVKTELFLKLWKLHRARTSLMLAQSNGTGSHSQMRYFMYYFDLKTS